MCKISLFTFIVWHLIKCVKFRWTIHTVWWEVICALIQHLSHFMHFCVGTKKTNLLAFYCSSVLFCKLCKKDVWLNALEDLEQSNPTTDPTSFTDYVTTYWLETRRHLWNHYLIQGPRTTNHLEGWHSKIKKQIQHAHPNISLEMPVPSQGHYGFQFSGCWLILSVYIIMSFDFPFVRLFGVR